MGAATTALRAADEAGVAACIMDSPFGSLPQVATELVNSGNTPIPPFLLSMALKVVSREIHSRANFWIEELLPIEQAGKAKCPALFAAASDDKFVLPHHAADLHKVWGGEKQLVNFKGGHNGAR